MDRVTIFMRSAAAADFDEFANGETVYVFEQLLPGNTPRLMEGPIWAFVEWLMPELSGLEMCRRLRADPQLRDAHVTMVLEQDDFEHRRRALRAGADDCCVGPLSRHAVLDRVLALQACRMRPQHHTVERGALLIDLAAEQARWRGTPISLRPNELRLLRFFAENPNRVFSRHELIDALGKKDDAVDGRTVDVWVKRLRFGLKEAGAEQFLRTVLCQGLHLRRALTWCGLGSKLFRGRTAPGRIAPEA